MEIVLTNIVNPINDKKAEWIKGAAIVISNGKIKEVGKDFQILEKYKNKNCKLIDRSEYICLPSFFDMHFHWVQDDVRLMPKDSLLEWLSKFTWPYEAKFKSIKYTEDKIKKFKAELLKCGTLGGACYASIHPHTTELAIENFLGDFIVGNVLMTMNSPEYLTETKAEAIDKVKKLSGRYKQKYAVTPRFAPTTHPEVMQEAATIGKKNKSFIQTHLSETKAEIDYVLSIYREFKAFKKVKNYTEIYHKTKILSPKTIMGHGIYLSKDELKLLAKTKTAICHCPTSNAEVSDLGLGSGLFNFKVAEKNKVRWALGSDIGGGPYLSMFDVMNSFVKQNKKKKIKEATFSKALFRATIAGAEILGLQKTNGSITKNKWANLIFIDGKNLMKQKSAESVLEKAITNIKKRQDFDHLVCETIFQGKTVYTSISR